MPENSSLPAALHLPLLLRTLGIKTPQGCMLALRILWSMMSRMKASLQFDAVLGGETPASRRPMPAPYNGPCGSSVSLADSLSPSQRQSPARRNAVLVRPIRASSQPFPWETKYACECTFFAPKNARAKKNLIATVLRLEFPVSYRKSKYMTFSNRNKNRVFFAGGSYLNLRPLFASLQAPNRETWTNRATSFLFAQKAFGGAIQSGRAVSQ
jgi:hypothetical protein